jgi:hypothetical protein
MPRDGIEKKNKSIKKMIKKTNNIKRTITKFKNDLKKSND